MNDVQEEFKKILEYGIRRGNENTSITVQQLVSELTEQLKGLIEKTKKYEEA
nr:hypothetical protein [Lysinibacillus timonensis]